jgi:general transcription factor 3C polypeptide 3 (transcription factor C subunit 4)
MLWIHDVLFHLKGVIYEELNQPRRALEFFTIAAHLTKRDPELWKQVAIKAKQLGDKKQAIYAFNKVLRLEPEDPEALWER